MLYEVITPKPIGTKLGNNSLWVAPYNIGVFEGHTKSKMAVSGEHILTLDPMGKYVQTYFSLELLSQLEPNSATIVIGSLHLVF